MRRALALGAAVVLAGCAAAPLPAARPLRRQSAQDLAWDSRTCGWTAWDASGYDPALSPDENAIVEFFVHGPRPGPPGPAVPAAVAPGSPSPDALGRGGRKTFDRVYEQCMTSRGYALSSRAAKETGR